MAFCLSRCFTYGCCALVRVADSRCCQSLQRIFSFISSSISRECLKLLCSINAHCIIVSKSLKRLSTGSHILVRRIAMKMFNNMKLPKTITVTKKRETAAESQKLENKLSGRKWRKNFLAATNFIKNFSNSSK